MSYVTKPRHQAEAPNDKESDHSIRQVDVGTSAAGTCTSHGKTGALRHFRKALNASTTEADFIAPTQAGSGTI